VGGMELHTWLFPLAAFRELQGDEGGEVNASTPIVKGWSENIGATVMGQYVRRRSRPLGENPWTGWWGGEPPFHHPVSVLTHHARDPLELQGGTTFHFVTDGIESALEQAKEAASGMDVSLGGGADVAQRYLAAGLVDEMEISVVPLLLGEAPACSTTRALQSPISNRFRPSRRPASCTSSTASGERSKAAESGRTGVPLSEHPRRRSRARQGGRG
jgi:dihydrofolate reductase